MAKAIRYDDDVQLRKLKRMLRRIMVSQDPLAPTTRRRKDAFVRWLAEAFPELPKSAGRALLVFGVIDFWFDLAYQDLLRELARSKKKKAKKK